ncbi:phosphoethanolamine transferase [Campylobacter gracilis]|uniref:Arylsulfatase n=1 Tax=Campylobacter gracilis RM3268 TaxID=553220 RepID=C8PHL3_9BACT|nr:phosphoethanolamine transferase [Campylobacter gracilis]AKT93292.1 phosphoethanolamine transferase [Campylobacter gracilis]EEV17627.1 arylsulfatase [Campylobacter gracilis RM3268]UEB44547.1 lipid A phosphoethanolamine transferase [Campylobacter gracilis]SUW78379.1 phosphoribosylformylglycinamidine cyclo-ligase [Campylobacter gracilis]
MSLVKNIGAFLKDRFSLLSVFDGAVLNAYVLVLVLNLALGLLLIARGGELLSAQALFFAVSAICGVTILFFALYALSFYSARLYKILAFALLAINVAFAIAQIFLIFSLELTYSHGTLDALVQTTPKEAFEFAHAFLNFKLIAAFLALLIFVIAALMLRVSQRARMKLCRAIKLIFLLSLLVFIAHAAFKSYVAKSSKMRASIIIALNKIPIYNFAFVTKDYFGADFKSVRELQAGYQSIYASHSHKTAPNRISNVVFIIGESLQRNFMSLYGYYLPTTPNLQALEKSGNLIAFSDVVSPGAKTNDVLKYVLNFGNYESEKQRPWSANLDIVNLARLANYETFWISNQERYGQWAVASGASAQMTDHSDFTNQIPVYKYAYSLDEVMLPSIKNFKSGAKRSPLARKDESSAAEVGSTQKKDKFFILHLMGSHPSYEFRYPKSFAKFSAADISREPLDEGQKKELAHYLNTVAYNDFIVSEIYKIFADDNTLIVYFSDHAQSLYQYRGKLIHGGINRFTLEIPLIFMASDKFKEQNADLWARIAAAKNRPFLNDDLIHAIAEILEMTDLPEYDPTRSVINSDFNASRPRIIEGVDYDKVYRLQKEFGE